MHKLKIRRKKPAQNGKCEGNAWATGSKAGVMEIKKKVRKQKIRRKKIRTKKSKKNGKYEGYARATGSKAGMKENHNI